MSLRKHTALAALLALFLPACGSWISVGRVASAQRKPNNVWVFMSVERIGDVPVEGLSADDFKVYEDGNESSSTSTKQALQAPDLAAAMYTLLLVDMSTSTTPAQADVLADAAKGFVESVGKTEKVAVYLFDGGNKLTPVVPFGEGKPATPAGLDAMRRYKTKDPSTNLNGAVVEGLRELRRGLDRDPKPLKLGTLVVMAEGGDRAGRVSRDDLRKELDDVKYEDFRVLGVGVRSSQSYLDDATRDGVELAGDRGGFGTALDHTATKIATREKRYYLLSFCTAARGGEHEIKVEVRVKNPDGSGSTSYRFTAEGLGPPPDCDPHTGPPADLKTVRAEERDKDRQSDARDKEDDARRNNSNKGTPGPKPVLVGPAAPTSGQPPP